MLIVAEVVCIDGGAALKNESRYLGVFSNSFIEIFMWIILSESFQTFICFLSIQSVKSDFSL